MLSVILCLMVGQFSGFYMNVCCPTFILSFLELFFVLKPCYSPQNGFPMIKTYLHTIVFTLTMQRRTFNFLNVEKWVFQLSFLLEEVYRDSTCDAAVDDVKEIVHAIEG